jgi:Putative Flp pilus-assembly TadE/G-like
MRLVIAISNRIDLLHRETAGSVAILIGFVLMVLLAIVGAVIDFSNVYRIDTRLRAYADSASIGAVATGSGGYRAASAMTMNGPVPIAEAIALQLFRAATVNDQGYTIAQVNASVDKSGNALTATTQYSVDVPTAVLGLFGIPKLSINRSSSATNGLPAYIDFYLFLDNSPSMGVAATPADIRTMAANTPDQCAFACHDQSNANNYYNLARTLGVTLRIDVLRTATQRLMNTANTITTVPNQFRMSIQTFNTNVQSIWNLSPDLQGAQSAASAIDLMPVPYQNWNNDRDTDLSGIWSTMSSLIPSSEDGTSPASPQKVLFLVSDGVSDRAVGSNRIIETIDPSQCQTLKSRGVKIAVLYTTYLPLPTNSFYNANVAPWSDTIGPSMASCASPGLYFEVSPTQGVDDAMNALFLKVVATARLSGS